MNSADVTAPPRPGSTGYRADVAGWFTRYPAVLPWGLAALFFALYTALSVRIHQRIRSTGYDLGIFEQIVRSYSQGHAPTSELLGPGVNALGDHFHPILALLAPIYLVVPSAVTLLVAQAALLALAVVPVTRWALRAVGPGAALVVGFGLGASYGFQGVAGFDFHEVCFAVPLLAFAVEAFGRRRWRVAVAWALPLLLVKEDLGLTVAVLGVLLVAKGRRRLGWSTAVAGALGTAVEVLVLIPAANTSGQYRFWEHVSSDGGLSGLLQLPLDLVTPSVKVETLILLVAPTAFLALRSPLLLLAVPTLGWRLLSDNSSYWDTSHQYGAVLMPIVFAAFVEALAAWRMVHHSQGPRSIRAALAGSAAVTVMLLPTQPLAQLAQPDTWRADARVGAAQRMLARIPDGASVAASNVLVPQLTNRCVVTVFPGYPDPDVRADWILDELNPPQRWPVSADEEAQRLDEVRAHGFRVVAQESGFILLHR